MLGILLAEWVRLDQRQLRLLPGAVLLSRFGALLARLGVVRMCLALLTGGAPAAPRYFVKVFGPTVARTLERLVGEVRKLLLELHAIVEAQWCQPKCFQAMADHLCVLQEATASLAETGSLGDVPQVVVSTRDQEPDVRAAQQALARTSSHGRFVVGSKSGHCHKNRNWSWRRFAKSSPVCLAITARREVRRAWRLHPSHSDGSRTRRLVRRNVMTARRHPGEEAYCFTSGSV